MKRQQRKTLEESFVAVDRLVDHFDEGIEEKKRKFDKMKEKPIKEDHVKVGGKVKAKKPMRCWLCGEEHTVKNSPSRPAVATLAQFDENKKEELAVGMMHILGVAATMKAFPLRDPYRNKLEYVDMKVGHITFLTMVDSGATHNFIREEVVRKIGLKFIPTQDHLKAMNSPLYQVISIANNVEVRIGEWFEKVDFTVVQ